MGWPCPNASFRGRGQASLVGAQTNAADRSMRTYVSRENGFNEPSRRDQMGLKNVIRVICAGYLTVDSDLSFTIEETRFPRK